MEIVPNFSGREEFKVEMGLYQESALNPFLFAMVIDRLTDKVIPESPWTALFAEDCDLQ